MKNSSTGQMHSTNVILNVMTKEDSFVEPIKDNVVLHLINVLRSMDLKFVKV